MNLEDTQITDAVSYKQLFEYAREKEGTHPYFRLHKYRDTGEIKADVAAPLSWNPDRRGKEMRAAAEELLADLYAEIYQEAIDILRPHDYGYDATDEDIEEVERYAGKIIHKYFDDVEYPIDSVSNLTTIVEHDEGIALGTSHDQYYPVNILAYVET